MISELSLEPEDARVMYALYIFSRKSLFSLCNTMGKWSARKEWKKEMKENEGRKEERKKEKEEGKEKGKEARKQLGGEGREREDGRK